MEYVYRATNARHKHCVDIWAPSTFVHLSDKLLQLAATNTTDGGHFNTHRGINSENFKCLGEHGMAFVLEPRLPETGVGGGLDREERRERTEPWFCVQVRAVPKARDGSIQPGIGHTFPCLADKPLHGNLVFAWCFT